VEEHPELYNNRQQFIETAIRESIEKYKLGNWSAEE
jgi:metal-responsive CopG/Arc/MetJ family transcriptional regulator